MFKRFSFWIWGTIITQLLSGLLHSISLFIKPVPTNDTEKQLVDLVANYKMEMGAGYSRSFREIFLSLSACFTLICLFAAIINWFFYRKDLAPALWKGLLMIEVIFFAVIFAINLRFTFLPPIICTGVVFLFCTGSYLSVKK